MSEEKEILALPIVPEEKLLSEGERLIGISPPEVYLELGPSKEVSILEAVPHSHLSESKTVAIEDISPVLPVSSEDTRILDSVEMDASIFDTVGIDTHPVSLGSGIPVVESTLVAPIVDIPATVPISIQEEVVPVVPTSEPQGVGVPLAQEIPPEQTIRKTPYKTIFLFVGIAVVCVAVIAGVVWAYTSRDDSIPLVEVQPTVSVEQKSIMTYEETIAKNIQDSEKDIEFMNRALSENDVVLCDAIQDESRKIECREGVIAKNISSSGVVQDCAVLTLSSIRDNCTTAVMQSDAIRSLDKSLCSQITDVAQASYCGDMIDQKVLAQLIQTNTASLDACAQLADIYRNQCVNSIKRTDDNALLQKSIAEENLDTCKSLSTEELQFTCFDTILLKQALKSGDRNLCDYVRDQGKKTTCLSYMDKQDDNMVFKSAIVEKNLIMCAKIITESLKNRCHDSVTLLMVRDTKNPSLCDTLVATGTIDSCKKSAGVQ